MDNKIREVIKELETMKQSSLKIANEVTKSIGTRTVFLSRASSYEGMIIKLKQIQEDKN